MQSPYKIKKIFWLALSVALAGCGGGKEEMASISGVVEGADGERLTLIHLAGNIPQTVDTLTLASDGHFAFKTAHELCGPDFFCLSLGGQTIPLTVDSMGTPVVIKAQKTHFAATYTAADSANETLRTAVALGNDLRRTLYGLTDRRQRKVLSEQRYTDSLRLVVEQYKATVLDRYIFQDPASPASYYLLFETVTGQTLFDPLNDKDSRAYGAVANLWMLHYPQSSRTHLLEQKARQGIAARYRKQREEARADSLFTEAARTVQTYIDLTLPGVQDIPVSLSDVCGGGHVTLLDFTAFAATETSVPHNELLSRLYAQHHKDGLRIFQVCLDGDENFWKVSASNLPWTVVRDPELYFNNDGVLQYSAAAATYNVTEIPTTFVMGKDGTPKARIIDGKGLENALTKEL